jgi:hypothetical protein
VSGFDVVERLRVGIVVRNAPFWDPALLARVVATTDILPHRRLELRLGAGRWKRAFDAASIPRSGFDTRARETIFELQRCFLSDPGKPRGTFRPGTAAEAVERVRLAREHERADEIEWHLLVPAAVAPTEPARGVRSRSNRTPPSAGEQTPVPQQSPQRADEFERCTKEQNEIR